MIFYSLAHLEHVLLCTPMEALRRVGTGYSQSYPQRFAVLPHGSFRVFLRTRAFIDGGCITEAEPPFCGGAFANYAAIVRWPGPSRQGRALCALPIPATAST